MDSWVIGQISFWYTAYEVQPAKIVDKCIAAFLDIVTPGRGAGESNWFQRGIRSLEQTSERASREMDIRKELRDWDSKYPQIHHEMIIRWVCGAVVSVAATSLYNSIVRGGSSSGSGGRRHARR